MLAGDVGATKANLALFSVGRPLRNFNKAATLIGDDYATALEAFQDYFESSGADAGYACFGVAGPVTERRVKMTNLDWVVDAAELEETLGLERVWLINDLKATAQAVPILEPGELATINAGQVDPEGVIGLIAPGTGLGIGYLTKDDRGYRAHATEGGHADFAPTDELQEELLRFLRPRFAHVSIESVCSGLGLPNVYQFLKETGRFKEPDWLRERLAAAEDPTPVIVEAALDEEKPSEICAQALQIFVDVLATTTSSLALTIGATGGIYMGGGIPPRILPLLKRKRFLDRYMNKVGYEEYLHRVPIRVILNTDAALLGAADYGLKRIAELT